MQKPLTTAAADQLAAHLREQRTGHEGHPCDALDPCSFCSAGRKLVQESRALTRVPAQR